MSASPRTRPVAGSPIDPSFQFNAVTPSDTALLQYNGVTALAKSLYIGVSGDVALMSDDGNHIVFKSVPVGLLRVSSTQVMATGTTATNILALY